MGIDNIDNDISLMAINEAFKGTDRPLKLMDVMQKSNKYRKLSLKNKTLSDAQDLVEIK